ncbi:MAG: glutathione S-transferase family protein [Alphaproteobacteria bacterium]|nr:glutathione S-transferase family protein [Alphaproteobacteria bacterium]
MIDLYSWPTPNGHKVHIMLEECGLEYAVHPVCIENGEQFAPDFLKISPNNKIPAIVDTGAAGGAPISVFETGAILYYLARKTGKFLPDETKDPAGHHAAMQWLMFQMGGVGPMFGQARHFRAYALERFPREKVEYGIDRYTNEAKRLYGVMDRHLAGNEYFAGAYSIADIAIFPWCRSPDRRGVDHDDYPNVKRWFEAVEARPAVQRGVEVLAERTRLGEHTPEAWNIMFGEKQYEKR